MTESEVDAEIGKLTREYAETNKLIAFVRHRLVGQKDCLGKVQAAINLATQGQSDAPRIACEQVNWKSLCDDAELLHELEAKRTELEHMLTQAGLSDLIHPAWKK